MKRPSHLLIIRLSAMGDVAMTVPVIRILKKTYPELKCSLITRESFKPLFSDIPDLEILAPDLEGKHKGLGILKLARKAKKLEIDAVADLHDVIRSKLISRFFKLKGINVAVINKGRRKKRALTRKQNKEFIPLKSTHQRYADVFTKLGLPVELTKPAFPKRKVLNEFLLNLIGKEPRKCIGIAPFATYKSKTYPKELMEEVILKLDQMKRLVLFLFGGGKEEIAMMEEWEKKYDSVQNTAGKLSFEDELALISNLDLMISMDSGNGHLAAIFMVPVITLWGVTHPYAGFAPFGQSLENSLLADREKYPMIPTSVYGNKYPEGYEKAIETISPDMVVTKIIELV